MGNHDIWAESTERKIEEYYKTRRKVDLKITKAWKEMRSMPAHMFTVEEIHLLNTLRPEYNIYTQISDVWDVRDGDKILKIYDRVSVNHAVEEWNKEQ